MTSIIHIVIIIKIMIIKIINELVLWESVEL
jgi:hypothetical protein